MVKAKTTNKKIKGGARKSKALVAAEREIRRLDAFISHISRRVCDEFYSERFGSVNKDRHSGGITCWDLKIANDWWCPSCLAKRALLDKWFTIDEIHPDSRYPQVDEPKIRRDNKEKILKLLLKHKSHTKIAEQLNIDERIVDNIISELAQDGDFDPNYGIDRIMRQYNKRMKQIEREQKQAQKQEQKENNEKNTD